MKVIKTIGLVIASLLLLAVLISFFLPSGFYVERSIVIQSDVAVPFALAKDFRAWDKWSPWHEIDTAMVKTYSEVQGEVGSYYTWDSQNPDAGKGKVTITNMSANEFIENKLEFDGMGVSTAKYLFEPVEGGTKVTWTLEGKGEGMPWFWKIPSKYFNLMMDKMIGKDYEKGLAKLKEISESTAPSEQIMGFDTEMRDFPITQIASITSSLKPAELSSNSFAKWFGQIAQAISSQKLKPAGVPMAIYHEYEPSKVTVETAIPVETAGTQTGNVAFREFGGFKALVVKHKGGYGNMEAVYETTYAYLESKQLKSQASPIEYYITDPELEPDTNKWLTEIVFPLTP